MQDAAIEELEILFPHLRRIWFGASGVTIYEQFRFVYSGSRMLCSAEARFCLVFCKIKTTRTTLVKRMQISPSGNDMQ